MLRRIMITFATIGTLLALTTAPAGAGAGSLELYSQPGGGGSHTGVPQATLSSYLNQCVAVSTIAGSFAEAQSASNQTQFNLYLYADAECDDPLYYLPAMTLWDSVTGTPVAGSVFVPRQ